MSQPKEIPEALALRAPPRPVTRLNRRTIAIVIAIGVAAVFGATFWSLHSQRVMRHPIPVSLATQKWSDTKPHSLIEHWLRAHELMAEDAPHVRRVHVMRYEDLVADPDSELRDVFGFLGLEDHGAGRPTAEGLNTDNFQADRTLRTGVNDRYFDDWDGPRRHTIVRRAYYDLTERRYEGRVRRFGYSLRRPHELRTPTLRLPGLSDRGARPAVAAAPAR